MDFKKVSCEIFTREHAWYRIKLNQITKLKSLQYVKVQKLKRLEIVDSFPTQMT